MTQVTPPPLAGTIPELSAEALGRFMPMFLWLDRRGRIRGLGPTLAKILGPEPVIGTPFVRHFALRRARATTREAGRDGGGHGGGGRGGGGGMGGGMGALIGGRRLNLTLAAWPEFSLRGTAEEVGPAGAGELLLNLSFGIDLAGAVRAFGLTEADFAPSDLAMELLYLNEAKAAVLGELRALTGRLEEARRSALDQALRDPLTGLANRRAFDAALERMLIMLPRGGRPFALAHIDLDFFKEVNDSLGHAAGDQVLMRTAEVLQGETRGGDMVARVGGDEFIMLLRGLTDRGQLQRLAGRIIARLEEPIGCEGRSCCISASIGIAVSSDYAAPDADRMLADADSALYHSKRSGRGCFTLHGDEEDAGQA